MADDRELWERICRGDAVAFDSFYQDSAPRLRNFLKLILGNAATAEDILQETFLQLWRRPNGFRPEKGLLRTYIFGMGKKLAAEWWRRSGPRTVAAVDRPERPRAEETSLMDDALSHLSEEQRSLLWLREVEGLSYSELADLFGIPVGTVRSRLFTARESLRIVWHGTPHAPKEGT